MGRVCGFSFYEMKDGKLVPANVITKDWGDGEQKVNDLFICGRCEATTIFLSAVMGKESPNAHCLWGEEKAKPEERYRADLLLNHPELDGFEVHEEDSEYPYPLEWFKKYFYIGFDRFEALFDFDAARKDHEDSLRRLREEIEGCHKEIESLRVHQEKAKTKVAFDCFEENIADIKERIDGLKETIKDLENDDYDYDHYICIENDLKTAKRISEEHPEIVVVAYASD